MEKCGAVSADGCRCTEQKGHAGNHAARSHHAAWSCRSWRNDDAPSSPGSSEGQQDALAAWDRLRERLEKVERIGAAGGPAWSTNAEVNQRIADIETVAARLRSPEGAPAGPEVPHDYAERMRAWVAGLRTPTPTDAPGDEERVSKRLATMHHALWQEDRPPNVDEMQTIIAASVLLARRAPMAHTHDFKWGSDFCYRCACGATLPGPEGAPAGPSVEEAANSWRVFEPKIKAAVGMVAVDGSRSSEAVAEIMGAFVEALTAAVHYRKPRTPAR